MLNSRLILVLAWLCCHALLVQAETFQLLDGSTVEGEIVLPAKADALHLRVGGGKYERIPWEKLTQDTLKSLAENAAVAQFVVPLIEVSDVERIKRTEVEIRAVPRLERPARGSVLGGLLSSALGIVTLLLIYAANIYAGYELAIVRAYPPMMVCAIAAVAPVIGPVIFLCLPTRLASASETTLVEAAQASQAHAAGVHESTSARAAAHASPSPYAVGEQPAGVPEPAAPAASVPEAQIFKRGQFTFNRRFIESKFPGLFGMARREADKHMVLVIKTPRGTFDAARITRISSTEMHVETPGGEVAVPFGEIQELIFKHQDS